MTTPTQKRVALVTGGSRGIGAAIVRRLAASGFHVVLNYLRSEEAAQAVAAEARAAGGEVDLAQGDVTDLAQVRAVMRQVQEKHARLDVLVNNAGRTVNRMLMLHPDADWWALVRDNLGPVVNCTRVALPMLLESKPSVIVNLASVSGVLRGVEGQTAYGAAKGAIAGFTRALARELSFKGVSVNCVAPGPIDTEMYETVSPEKRAARVSTLPVGRLGRADEVAEVVGLLAEGKAAFVHGQILAVDGGATC
jgi:3-oxoacyl-[acyl-carrier protein] reductase